MKKGVRALLLIVLSLLLTQTPFSQTRQRRTGKTSTQPSASSETQADSKNPSPDGKEVIEVGEGDVLRVDTTLVTIPVSVMDRNGKFIPDLTAEDFRIYEDSVEQKIAYFQSVEQPFTVVFMLDTSSSTWSKLGQIKDAAVAFLDQLRPQDKVMVFSFAKGLTLVSEPTSDREALRKSIQGIGKGMSTHLYDAVEKVVKEYLGGIKGRKAIVLFTDGVDASSNRATAESNLREVEELDALIFPIRYDTYSEAYDATTTGTQTASRLPSIFGRLPFPFPSTTVGSSRGSGSTRADYERGRRYLYDLAERTGGQAYEANKDKRTMDEAFRKIAEELRRQYSLGYYPKAQGRAGERRYIKVRVEQPGAVVRARDSFIFNPQTASDKDSKAQKSDDKGTQTPPQPVLKKSPFAEVKPGR